MTARDWLMRQNPARRPRTGGVQMSESFARLVQAAAAERVRSGEAQQRVEAVLAAAAEPEPTDAPRFTEAAVTSARAPWVPPEQARPVLSVVETARLDAAFDRRPDCRVCDIRYSHCYPFNHGGRRA